MGDRGNPIGFFDAQFVGMADNGCAVRERAGDGQDWQLIDQLRNFFPMNDRAFERRAGHFDNAARFQLIAIFDCFAHLRAHSHQDTEQGRPGIIQPDVAHEKMASRLRSRCHQPKRR